MRYTLTFDGVPVGFVDLVGGPRAAGPLFTLPAFEASGLRRAARALGLALRVVGWHRVPSRASARALAGAIAGAAGIEPRLGPVDEWSAAVAVSRVLAAEFPDDRTPIVVAALREQAAASGAEPARWAAGPGEASRPAA